MTKQRIGTDLITVVCIMVLWWQVGLSFWWLVGLAVLAWAINLLPVIQQLIRVAQKIQNKAMLDTLRRIEENTAREAEKLRQESLKERERWPREVN